MTKLRTIYLIVLVICGQVLFAQEGSVTTDSSSLNDVYFDNWKGALNLENDQRLYDRAESTMQVLFWIHIPVGVISLGLFWIILFTKKGGKLHRKAGKYFFSLMWIVLATSFLMSICILATGRPLVGVVLAYLTILISYPLWYSPRILRQHKVWSKKYFRTRQIFLAVISLSALALAVPVVSNKIPAFSLELKVIVVFFALLGLLMGQNLRLSFTKAMEKESKLKMHIRGTIISGIAAHTAFFVFRTNHMVQLYDISPYWRILAWLVPFVLGVTYIFRLSKKYNLT